MLIGIGTFGLLLIPFLWLALSRQAAKEAALSAWAKHNGLQILAKLVAPTPRETRHEAMPTVYRVLVRDAAGAERSASVTIAHGDAVPRDVTVQWQPSDPEFVRAASLSKYRTFWRRFGASFVDFVVFVPVMALELQIGSLASSHIAKVCLLLLSSFLRPAYSIGMHWRFGATIGKWALGLRVLNIAEGPISLRQATLRDALALVMMPYSIAVSVQAIYADIPVEAVDNQTTNWVLGFVLVLELLTMLFNEKRRSLHDLIAGTVVVRVR